MNNEKSFCIGNTETDQLNGQRNSFNPTEAIDKSVLAEMKKYKNCHPDDVSILKGLKLKISNYILSAEQDEANFKAQSNQIMNSSEIFTFL